MNTAPNGIYEFGPFRIDPDRETVLRGGEPLAVTPKAFEVLVALVRRSHQVVTKDELLQAVWPGRVVEEANLSQCIFLLRKLLGDTPDARRYIVTLPGKGYRFAAPVRTLAPELDAEAPIPPESPVTGAAVPEQPSAPRTRPAARKGAFAVIGALIVVVLLASGYFIKRGASTRATARIPTKSVAVLPFTNESGERSQQYFSDGLSEDLITALSQFSGLKVISRDSSFQFRNSKDSSAEIGRALGVAHLLEGSVQRAGNEVRITATLVDAANGSVVWSRRYDKPYTDLFALQDAITTAVSGALKTKLLTTPGAVVQSDRPPSGNLDAYAAFLQGEAAAVLGDLCSGKPGAMADFRKAIRLDPRYALAYARVAQCWVGAFRVNAHTAAEGQWQIANARAAIRTALALDPDLAAARVVHGFALYSLDFDWYGAESEYRRALQLAPNDPDAMAGLANVLATLGQLRAAIALQRAALKLNPRSAFGWMALGGMLAGNGQLDAAARACRKSLALARRAGFCNWQQVVIEVLGGHAQRAMTLAREVPAGSGWRSLAIAAAAQIRSNRAEADAALQRAIADNANANGNYQIADLYALRGDPGSMFKYLDRARDRRDAGVGFLLYDPLILRYEADPRFAAFCKSVGLPTVTDAVAMK